MDLLKVRRQLDSGKTIFELPLRVVYYARVSTDRSEQLNSLENQITYYEGFIKENVNWTFKGGYVDEGISGTSVLKRENFLRMVSDAGQGMFDLIVTKEISRFSRSTLDSVKYTQELLEYGVGVYFQSDNINTLYADAELRLTIMSSIAQDDVRRLSERVKFGIRRAYESGRVLGSDNIYGYNKHNCRLVINEEEAVFVRELFTMYSEGKYGFRTIARLMTESGRRGRLGKELSPATLKGIIQNPKYKGYYSGRLTESNDYRKKKNIKVAEEDRLLYRDERIPAIVTEELWEQANAILKKRSEKFHSKSSGTQSRFPYSGKIMCEAHGAHHYRKVLGSGKTVSETWCCREYLKGGRKRCVTPNIHTNQLDTVMEYTGRRLLTSEEKRASSIDGLLRLYETAKSETDSLSIEMSRARKELGRTKAKQDRIMDLLVDGCLDKAAFLEMNEKLNSSAARLSTRLKELETERLNTKCQYEQKKTEEYLSALFEDGQTALYAARQMLKGVLVLKSSNKAIIRLKINMAYKTFHALIVYPFILYGETEVSPIVGTEKQSAELIEFLMSEFETDPSKIWESNIFGKSLYDMVTEGLQNKLYRMPEDAQLKLQETLQKIINEGNGGMICIIL